MRAPLSRVSRRALAVSFLTLALIAGSAMLVYSADSVIATVNVGDSPSAIGVNPVSHRVYVTNYWGGTVSVLDGTTNSNVATVGSGGFTVPLAVVVDSLASPAKAFVGNWWTGTVEVIDESSTVVTQTLLSGAAHGGGPRALVLDGSTNPRKLFGAIHGRGELAVWNAETGARLATVTVGSAPRALALYPGSGVHRRVYVVNRGDDTVSVVNASTYGVVGTVATGAGVKAVAVDPDTGNAYVTAEYANTVTVIDEDANVLATVNVGSTPKGLAVDATNDRVFVANFGSGTVSVIRTTDYTNAATITVGTGPLAVAVDEGDGKTYVTNQGGNTVSVIDATTLGVTNIGVGGQPSGVAVDSALTPHQAYVSNWASATVSVVDEPAAPGPLAALAPKVATAAGAPAVMVVVDSTTPRSGGIVEVSGRALGVRTPVPLPIQAVFWREQGEAAWRPVDAATGLDTLEAAWAFTFDPGADPAEHMLEIAAFDSAGVASSSSDAGLAGASGSFGGGASVTVGAADSEPPAVTAQVAGSPVAMGGTVTLSAEASDAQSGGSTIASMEYSVNGGPWTAMAPDDGAFDEPVESATAHVNFGTAGFPVVSVRAADAAGNVSHPVDVPVVVNDPAGRVKGRGWFDVPWPPGAATTERVKLSVNVRYPSASAPPAGSFESGLPDGGTLAATGFDWLVAVNNRATLAGPAAVSGVSGYRFEFVVVDGVGAAWREDAVRLRVWDANGAMIYDLSAAGELLPLGGGNVTVVSTAPASTAAAGASSKVAVRLLRLR